MVASTELIEISQDNNISEQLQFQTNANFLCNFMRKSEYLISAITDMALKPRYFEEKIDYLKIPNLQSITFPMTCFCDIPLSKVSGHMLEYGDFGLALNINACIKKDIQPITYINKNARLRDDIAEAFAKLITCNSRVEPDWQFLPDLLLSQLLYMKPIDGEMRRDDGDFYKRVFKDECEWRYIPKLPQEMPLILPQKYNNARGKQVYSGVLAKDKKTWLTFEIDDIDYLIVPSEEEAMALIRAIKRIRKNKTEDDKLRLISKIEVASKFKKNLV